MLSPVYLLSHVTTHVTSSQEQDEGQRGAPRAPISYAHQRHRPTPTGPADLARRPGTPTGHADPARRPLRDSDDHADEGIVLEVIAQVSVGQLGADRVGADGRPEDHLAHASRRHAKLSRPTMR